MKGISISRAAQVCGGEIYGEYSESQLGRVIIDSRQVRPGDLFVAYKGANVDGHDYVPVAFAAGAACCLVQRLEEGWKGPVILCEDVQQALEKITAACRQELSLPVVGITGSVGKTTAKEMIWSVLQQRMNVLKTDKNLNNQIGVPMTVSRIGDEHDCAVIEMGISKFGDMAALAPMTMPDIMVYTVIGHAHLEFLGDLDGVLRAKTELFPMLKKESLVIMNGDDEKLYGSACPCRRVFYGLSRHCQLRAEDIESLADGSLSCRIVYPGGSFPVNIPAFGKHMVYAALAGAAVGLELGLSEEEIAAGISAYETVGRRAAVCSTGYLTLVDDCYNANPDSVRSGIDSLMSLPGRHVCILGDMLELGEGSGEMHRQVGAYAVEKGAQAVICCGGFAEDIAAGAGDKGLAFKDRQQLIAALPELLKAGDAVLVKASHSSRFEEISEAVKLLK